MVHGLLEAASTGDVRMLHRLVQENQYILYDVLLFPPHENPLNVAIKARQLFFVKEIIGLNSELAKEAGQDGFRPMDIAAAYGYEEIVRELLAVDPNMCRLAGRDHRTALHCAAINGRVEIVRELLSVCPEAVKDVTILGETALHLAVKHFKVEVLRQLMPCVDGCGVAEMVNWTDKDGNTLLHLAVSRIQIEAVQLLLDRDNNSASGLVLELNAVNRKGLTAMDVVDILIDSYCSSRDVLVIRDIIQGAAEYGNLTVNATSPARPLQHVTTPNRTEDQQENGDRYGASEDWIKYFQFKRERDAPGEARNALLVVAALVATVTFQAGVNPPSFFVQPQPQTQADQLSRNSSSSTVSTSTSSVVNRSTEFFFWNALGFTTSVVIIGYLTQNFPFQWELFVAFFAMTSAYALPIKYATQDGVVSAGILGVAALIPLSLRWLRRILLKLKKIWKCCRGHSADHEPHQGNTA